MPLTPFSPSLSFPDKEQQFAALLAERKREACLELIVAEVNVLCTSAKYSGSALYLPGLDQLLAKISAQIDAEAEPCPRPAAPWDVVVVASQMELQGGHSRIIEDICLAVPNPLLILTDPYNSYAEAKLELGLFSERVPDALVMVIPNIGLVNKGKELHRLCRSLDAQNIFVLTHHSDPVAFVGLSALKTNPAVRKFLVHHADHNPALGMTIDGFVHVDCTEHLREICAEQLGRPASLLPLAVSDGGLRLRKWPDRIDSTVTAGSESKFQRRGELAYASIVARILSVTSGPHHHIGELPDDWVNDIRRNLADQHIDPARFAYTGSVPSLWQQLKVIDADLYVASAPVGGGRAATEAQGCGYPVAYFKNPAQPLLFQIDEVYATKDLKWANLDNLADLLRMDGGRLHSLAEVARRHYLSGYSGDAFRAALRALLARES
jgi:hypothetical protein